MDLSVDRSTGTITARATIGNGKFTLLPGQYVRVRLHVKQQADALMVPQTALGSSQLGKYVYVVGADGKVASVRLVEGNAALSRAAMDAVRQWRYRPYVRNGKTQAFQTVVIVDFQRP